MPECFADTDIDRFMRRFDAHAGNQPEECWVWRAKGYEFTQAGGGNMRANRWAWVHILRQPIDRKMNVRTKCGNPLCVRPEHLYRESRRRFMLDKVKARGGTWLPCSSEDAKARILARGSDYRNPKAKLTVDQVRWIRAQAEAVPTADIARALGFDWSTVADARKGNTWLHIPRTEVASV